MNPSPALAYKIAKGLHAKGLFVEAEKICRALVAAQPGNTDILNFYGTVLRSAGRLDEALRLYDQVLEKDAGHVNAHYNKAKVLLKLMRPQAALASITKAIDLAPDDERLLSYRGLVLTMTGRLEDALQDYRRIWGVPLDSNVMRLIEGKGGGAVLEFLPKNGTPLYIDDNPTATVRIKFDPVIAANAVRSGGWHVGDLKVISNKAWNPDIPICLVDVGANVGLFSRQLLRHFGNIASVFLYEPEPGNYAFLKHNIPDSRAIFRNAGLSDRRGSADFFVDPGNSGNYSLNRTSIRGQSKKVSVMLLDALEESKQWQKNVPNRFFYKSDTQGHDETIACRIDWNFWARVEGGLMELYRIEKPDHDRRKFAAILDLFSKKVFVDAPEVDLTTQQVMQYLEGTDGRFNDLVFWGNRHGAV